MLIVKHGLVPACGRGGMGDPALQHDPMASGASGAISLQRHGVLLTAVLLAAGLSVHGDEHRPGWEPIGLSGGGAMYSPAISPLDGKLMMVNCDMSAAYLSRDGGASWHMIHHAQLRANTRCRPAFHPLDRQVIFAANGLNALSVSRDGGEQWQAIGNLPGDLHGEIAIDRGNPLCMLVGASGGVWRSADGGTTWIHCDGPKGTALSFHFDQSGEPNAHACFAATVNGVWRSDDGGVSWSERDRGLPWHDVRSFAGGSDAHQCMLYCAIPSRVVAGAFSGGIYRSHDRGDSWQAVPGKGLNREIMRFDEWGAGDICQYHRVITSDARPLTVYACNSSTGIPPPHHATVFRSDDGGDSWQVRYNPDPRFPGVNVEPDYTTVEDQQYYQDVPDGVAGDANDPEHLVITDSGCLHATTDGGAHWISGHVRAGTRDAANHVTGWRNSGLVVTTTWNFYIDPFQANRQYICYTDIGFARSFDQGANWHWWPAKGRPPWRNTCYELAFDPATPGKIWGAFSNVHDIPNGNIVWGNHSANGTGGVALSTDFAGSWSVAGSGLPQAPVTAVVIDPTSPVGSRTLYAGVFGAGVFVSRDDGGTWTAASMGLGSEQNKRVCRVLRHHDGTLFALVTALRKDGRFLPDGVGLYRSKDNAANWELVNRGTILRWPKDVTIDPDNSAIMYLSACDINGPDGAEEAGLYRSSDAGMTWKRLAREGHEHFGAYLHPQHPGWIYMTLCEGPSGAGLFLSTDKGTSFKPIEGLPFSNIQRVTVDPADPTIIYVTTFGGGVWRGPAGG